MKTANFPGRKKVRRDSAWSRFSILPKQASETDEEYASYVARKATESESLKRLRHS